MKAIFETQDGLLAVDEVPEPLERQLRRMVRPQLTFQFQNMVQPYRAYELLAAYDGMKMPHYREIPT